MIDNNIIDPSAEIDESVILGKYNRIGKNVQIKGFKGEKGAPIILGDCNIIHDNTRVLIGKEGATIGDWNVFHNDILIVGEKKLEIGHNCWFGQNSVIDSSGGLNIGNGFRVGMYSQIWTHVGSGELIEGCTLFGDKPTKIEDDVWLVGSCTVSPGLILGQKSICLSHSNVTKNTLPGRVYAGNPSKILESANFYRQLSLVDKLDLMTQWVKIFVKKNRSIDEVMYDNDKIQIQSNDGDKLIILKHRAEKCNISNASCFFLSDKTYTKTLSELERSFYSYIYNNKARFIPVSE